MDSCGHRTGQRLCHERFSARPHAKNCGGGVDVFRPRVDGLASGRAEFELALYAGIGIYIARSFIRMSRDKGPRPGISGVGAHLFARDAYRGIYGEGTSTRISFEAVLSAPFARTALAT